MRLSASRLVAAVCALLFLVGIPALADEPDPSTWVVQFRPDATASERQAALSSPGTTVLGTLADGEFALVEAVFPPVHAAVVQASPPVPMRAEAEAPNDPLYRFQWHLPAVQIPQAWDVTTGTGAVVAVLDTGVAYENHGAFLRAPDLAQTRFVPGWDFVNNDSHPNDDNGHGTHVAGTVAQSTGNALGTAGVAPGATLMPVKVLDDEGGGTDWDIAQGVRWATDHGADVANLSIAGAGSSSVLRDAVTYAVSHGVTVVAAAGNDNGPVTYPAAYADVIAVGAVRHDRSRAPYSNVGAALDIVAPGGDLSVDQNRDGYGDGIVQQTFRDGLPAQFCWCFYQGTSMATPHVAATAALLVAQGAASTPAEVRSALLGSALDLGAAGWDSQTGAGLVQASAALDYARVLFGSAPAPTPAPSTNTPEQAGDDFVARSIDDSCPDGAVSSAGFADVPSTNPHGLAIDCLAWWAVAAGRADGSYGPAAPVSRAQMASFLVRLLDATDVALPPSPPDAFVDDESSAHEFAINQLAALAVVSGTGDRTFDPSHLVTRAQMATFLVRAAERTAGPLGPAASDHFADDAGSSHEGSVNLAAELGLASGTASAVYSPALSVRRDQMASFLARTLDLLVELGNADPPAA